MIAAGEVVERPMGVVKELVENSIDAGANRIHISIEDGGMQRITVQDNGCGMDSSDATTAFARHATSKIQKENDLWSIHTLGFRGEALPSIASVSKVIMKTSDGKDSTKVTISYGKLEEASVYPCDQGTEISVEGLFYQTPARLKHIRSSAYEASLIQDVVGKFALSHPEIAFVYDSDGRDVLRTSGQNNLVEVVYQVFGSSAAENAIEVDFEDFDYHVTGIIVKPTITRASRNMMDIFINQRMVKTYRLYKAVQEGYEDFIVKGRFPLCVLNIEMDPQLLDVNVHPSKWEVRLSKEKQLEKLIQDEVRNALKSHGLEPHTNIQEAKIDYYEPVHFRDELLAPTKEVNQEVTLQDATPKYIPTPKEEIPILQEEKTLPEMQVIGQLHEKFILCACEEGLVIIDQHAAQERVHYEEYIRALNQNPPMVQTLIPIVLETTDSIVQRVDELNEAIADTHIVFEPFGGNSLAVREVPSWMVDIDENKFLEDILDYFVNEKDIRYAKMEKKTIATMACHHSIRFNHSLTYEEMVEVVEQLKTCENPYHCPHGRPTFIVVDEDILTKEFYR